MFILIIIASYHIQIPNNIKMNESKRAKLICSSSEFLKERPETNTFIGTSLRYIGSN